MKTIFYRLSQLMVFIIAMCAIASIPGTAFSEDAIELRLNVGFKYKQLSHSIKHILSRHRAKKIIEARKINMATYSVPSEYREQLSRALLSTDSVSFVERDRMSSIPPGEAPVMASVIPNDPDYTDQ